MDGICRDCVEISSKLYYLDVACCVGCVELLKMAVGVEL